MRLSETPLLTDQVPYRLPERKYAESGVLAYCQQNEILLTAYSPVKFQNLPVNKTIRAIADAHEATPFQIALAWLVAQPCVITIPMSLNPQHIRENFAAAEIELKEEIDRLAKGLRAPRSDSDAWLELTDLALSVAATGAAPSAGHP